jgi:16S rRNA (uracil1498-N3)-methyltransferase
LLLSTPGKSYLVKINEFNYEKKEVKCYLIKELVEENNKELSLSIILIVPLLKQKKIEFIIKKASQLGCKLLVPFQFTRSIKRVKIDFQNQKKKEERWRKIALSNSSLAKLNNCMLIGDTLTDLILLKNFISDLNLIAHPDLESKITIKTALKEKEFKSVTLITGPEGGFTESELKVIKSLGFKNVTLGKKILDAELAPIFSLMAIIYEKELS